MRRHQLEHSSINGCSEEEGSLDLLIFGDCFETDNSNLISLGSEPFSISYNSTCVTCWVKSNRSDEHSLKLLIICFTFSLL